jgi:hypothetical protein
MENGLAVRLTRLLKEFGEQGSNRTAGRPLGFYWTRKSANLARLIIEEFSAANSIVMDPFLGSGSSAMGALEANGNRLFVGIELNEMPLESLNISFTTPKWHGPNEFQEARQFLTKIADMYVFEMEGSSYTLQKTIFDRTEKGPVPTAFHCSSIQGNFVFSKSELSNRYTELLALYNERVNNLPKRKDIRFLENSRIAIKDGLKASDLFGPLNFEALSQSRTLAKKNGYIRIALTTGLHLCKFTDAKSQSQFPYWYPKSDIHEKSAALVLKNKLREIHDHLSEPSLYTDSYSIGSYQEWISSQNKTFLISQGNSMDPLTEFVPENSVDLVITDPPYFDQVAYSEYLKLWEFFTGHKSDLDAELVQTNRKNASKNRETYLAGIELAFAHVANVLKEEGLVIVYFKDSKPKNLHAFISALGRAQLTYICQRHLPKPGFTYKQNATKEGTVSGDALLIFQKQSKIHFREPVVTVGMESLDAEFLELFGGYIDSHGPSSLTQVLDDVLVENLYPTGYFGEIKSGTHFNDLLSLTFKYDSTTRTWSR